MSVECKEKVISAAELRFSRDVAKLDLPHYMTIREPSSMEVKIEMSFQDGIFRDLRLRFAIKASESYPFNPPKVICESNVFHPNVCPKSGIVCMNVLRLEWRPIFDIGLIILAIYSLFTDEFIIDADDCLNKEAAELYLSNKAQYVVKSRQSV